MKIVKSPQKEVESYLVTELNIEIYDDLTEVEQWKGLFNPLEFFNLLYADFYFFDSNNRNYKAIKEYFGKNKFKGYQRYYFFWAMNQLLDRAYTGEQGLEEVQSSSIAFIGKLFSIVESELFPHSRDLNASKFDFKRVKSHLESLSDFREKIKYLTEIKTEFEQTETDEIFFDANFAKQCQLEIRKIKEISKLELVDRSWHSQENPQIKLKLADSFSKIDYIRIINALVELRCFQNEDGTFPTKQDVMRIYGSLVGLDLSNYSKDLNKAFNTNVTAAQNVEIFERLKVKTNELYTNKQNKGKN